MLELIKLRAQMLSGNVPADEMKDLKLKATSEIDTGNKILGKVDQHLPRLSAICLCENVKQILQRAREALGYFLINLIFACHFFARLFFGTQVSTWLYVMIMETYWTSIRRQRHSSMNIMFARQTEFDGLRWVEGKFYFKAVNVVNEMRERTGLRIT